MGLNGEGLIGWDADIVDGNTISITVANKYNWTTNDAGSPMHPTYSTKVVQHTTFNASKSGSRVTSLAVDSTSLTDSQYRIVTGETGIAALPQVFRKTWAVTSGADDPFSLAKNTLLFPALDFTSTTAITYTEIGGGMTAPTDSFDDFSGTGDLEVTFNRNDPNQMSWVVSCPIAGSGDTFTVDPFTLKKSGSSNFGFTKTVNPTNPGTIDGSPVTSWDVQFVCTVTVS